MFPSGCANGEAGWGSVATARPTETSFPRYVAGADPADLQAMTQFVHPTPGAVATALFLRAE